MFEAALASIADAAAERNCHLELILTDLVGLIRPGST